MNFKVRNNKTRNWCEGDFCLDDEGILYAWDMGVDLDDISDTHTACFPVGRQDRDKVEIYDGDNLISHDVVYEAKLDGMYIDGEFYIQWRGVEFSTLEIIPPTPKPKVLTWPELEDGTCFMLHTAQEGLIPVIQDTKVFVRSDGSFRDYDSMVHYPSTNCRDISLTIVTPTWKEQE